MFDRREIYYWKCDRPSAFEIRHVSDIQKRKVFIESLLQEYLDTYFSGAPFTLTPAGSQGNHITYIVDSQEKQFFIRLEDGQERDNYMEVESRIATMLQTKQIPVPAMFHLNTNREKLPFAIQIMEYLPYSDLNKLYKNGDIKLRTIANRIGRYIGRWQQIPTRNFGLFDVRHLQKTGELQGFHQLYKDYFFLNWDKHLNFLAKSGLMNSERISAIDAIVKDHESVMNINDSCLVHKDIALWNILGTSTDIKAIIDWDDAIAGDPTDDLSLLACFHSGPDVCAAIEGYQEVRNLPSDFEERFWLHLLRNIIFKAVIRVGAGYFEESGDFFLVNSGNKKNDLRRMTLNKINLAYNGLNGKIKIEEL
ncbi:aminoglycoside phosphotransferase family protein [Pollutibacter soli]|uniref:phosphotransferase family protein n=1 Tax=Pollutibacter soli TaxID=3034157 RepID=UPI0030131F09